MLTGSSELEAINSMIFSKDENLYIHQVMISRKYVPRIDHTHRTGWNNMPSTLNDNSAPGIFWNLHNLVSSLIGLCYEL